MGLGLLKPRHYYRDLMRPAHHRLNSKVVWFGTALAVALGSSGVILLRAESAGRIPAPNPSNNSIGASVNQSITSSPQTTEPPAPQPTASPSTTGNASSITSDVTVNGQHIDVPANGSIQQTVTNPDGSEVNVSASNQQSQSGNSSNSSNIHINSNTSTSSTSVQMNSNLNITAQ